ncbi:nuclear transport factor 2 family protein [Luteimonas terrae]|uniref:SnoaL-like domain-containing protein n=1 Tax=Luteimonas terrae TaxID=1530191 RepID=A0ABU1Y0L5_9GAMM|nr:nuclear transport factor 2 family protein [Luteimonas terrae]MDR7194564.1 hypothetical protein [Luteimonas terrae]
MQLPDTIASFFAIGNGADPTGLRDCFTADAVVHDERQTHTGIAAIEAWLAAARAASAWQAEPFEIAGDAGHPVVQVHLTGSFPGSPVTLAYRFAMVDGRIAELEIR